MEFSSALRTLANGRAIKRPSMLGYIERVNTHSEYSAATTYAIGAKVVYNGNQYTATQASSASAVHTPNETDYWTQDAAVAYKLVWLKRSGTAYNIFLNGALGTDSTGLSITKELATHMMASDWLEGASADFASALSPSSGTEW